MKPCTRREWITSTGMAAAGGMAAGGLSSVSTARAVAGSARRGGGMQLALFMRRDASQMKLARQIGVNHAIVGVSGDLGKTTPENYVDALKRVKAHYEAAGITIAGVESHPVPAGKITLGLPGRDDEIGNYCEAIKALGAVGIRMCCYNFMAGLGWYRTRFDILERGGALTSEFDYETAQKEGPTEWGTITEDEVWDNMRYFLERVIPVAEKAGVNMALHPDDPPISPLRGIGRILTSGDAFRRVMDIVPSPVNGITFCQANFRAMGEDIETLAREFCEQGKVFFVHFRDIEGGREHFHETFHDNGPTDMGKMLAIYADSGFEGPIRPDHAPTLEGESENSRGYGMTGKVFALGYMQGLMEAQGIPFR